MKLLKTLKTYQDFLNLKKSDLNLLANEIREYLIDLGYKKSIHWSSNLGIVELSIALAYFFNLDQHKVFYDTSHQAYVHKMITGRFDQMDSIRETNGLSGLQNMNESKYDFYAGGHTSNSLSVASGLVFSNELLNNDQLIVPVIGDGSIANGIAFEAINNIGFHKHKMIVVINDNQMSISENFGEFNKMLSNLKDDDKNFFKQLGFSYIKVEDGHNLDAIFEGLEKAKQEVKNNPVIVHVKTIKGKGIKEAENDLIGSYHNSNRTNKTYEDQVGFAAAKYLDEKLKNNEKICLINPAMTYATGFINLINKYQKNYIDVGISEEHALSMASGVSINKIPVFLPIYSTFLQRSYDQLIHDLSRLNLGINLLIDRCGLNGTEGSSHHGIFDVGMIKNTPNSRIYAVSNPIVLERMINQATNNTDQVWAIRYPRYLEPFQNHEIYYKFNENINDWVKLNLFRILNRTALISYNNNANIFKTLLDQNGMAYIDSYDAILVHGEGLDQNIIQILNLYDEIYLYEDIYGNVGLANEFYRIMATHNYQNKKLIVYNFKQIPEHGNNKDLLNELNMGHEQVIEEIKKAHNHCDDQSVEIKRL
ncbi:1-deoxy-D-xylulose-5-phosphate synthase [Mycoplasma sp. E35C]|uniref:1-deoxy-D-xylulose-5-phosphate synthase n=1 Tax=Mycoplasma sp. E35C TaxID=2801918 RepID=UPI001CA42369|nr:1-deoxy-D-xylulose-5-phosphate synthase [Mycoplasma sp. E35C]QZX49436.1 1-deoxy-D-xylulose-5-phosphate synthase [Mycoplasma sp. E35C]